MPGENNHLMEKTQENRQATSKTILLVEDDTTIAEILIQMITQETQYRVYAVPDGPQALDLVKNIKPKLLILDYWLPTTNGIVLYDLLHNTEGLEGSLRSCIAFTHRYARSINAKLCI